jgi:hypothetical protein
MAPRHVVKVLYLSWLFFIGIQAKLLLRGGPSYSCPAQSDWFPECWVAANARISIGGDQTIYWTPNTSSRWGNALSPYWQARALAYLAGYGFNAYVGFDQSWLVHLPKKIDPSSCPDESRFKAACDSCDSDSYEYAHRCIGAWTYIRPLIQQDTLAAFADWAKAEGHSLPKFDPQDIAIQIRCAKDTILEHPEYGPVAFSFYKHIKPTTSTIYLVTDKAVTYPVCLRLLDALHSFLGTLYPSIPIKFVGGTREEDFARLLLAPTLFKDSQSSFGLWAGLANEGEVYSVPMLPDFTHNQTTPDLGASWHWVDAPVLYPAVAAAAGLTADDHAGIIQWLVSH